MKKFYPLIILLMCIAAPASIRAKKSVRSHEITQVEMHVSTCDSSVINRAPERYPLELTCEVFEELGMVSLSANKAVSSEIMIHNFSTGNHVSYLEEISAIPLFLPTLGQGYYIITVSLSNQKSYSGEFEL